MDSWQVWRKIRPAETAHTVVATVDGELSEWTDTDLTAGDRRYKVAAVRDSLTSRRSRVAKLIIDEPPPPLRPTPSTITQVPEKEPLTEKAAGDSCVIPLSAAARLEITLGTTTYVGVDWVEVSLDSGTEYQIDVYGGRPKLEFVCSPAPDREELADTTANSGTGLIGTSASLNFTPSTTGTHYMKVTGTDLVRVTDLSDDSCSENTGTTCTATVGNAGLAGAIDTPSDYDWVKVPLANGTSYQIDVRSVGYPGIDPWIVDIYDKRGDRITRPAGTTEAPYFGASYDGFFDHDSGPGNAARVVYTATEGGNHYIKVASRGGWPQRPGDWRLKVTEASAPFFDDYAADASTSGAVVVGGAAVSGRIDSTPSWYNAGDTGGPNGYSSHEPGWTGAYSGYSCHRETGDGIELDGDTCDRDWFKVELTRNRTYKLQLEGDQDKLLIDGVYRFGSLYQKGGTTYTASSNGTHYISVAGTGGCYGLHGCTGSYTLSVTQE